MHDRYLWSVHDGYLWLFYCSFFPALSALTVAAYTSFSSCCDEPLSSDDWGPFSEVMKLTSACEVAILVAASTVALPGATTRGR